MIFCVFLVYIFVIVNIDAVYGHWFPVNIELKESIVYIYNSTNIASRCVERVSSTREMVSA